MKKHLWVFGAVVVGIAWLIFQRKSVAGVLNSDGTFTRTSDFEGGPIVRADGTVIKGNTVTVGKPTLTKASDSWSMEYVDELGTY